MYYNVYLSSIGNIVLESDGVYLMGLYFDEHIPSIITDLEIFILQEKIPTLKYPLNLEEHHIK